MRVKARYGFYGVSGYIRWVYECFSCRHKIRYEYGSKSICIVPFTGFTGSFVSASIQSVVTIGCEMVRFESLLFIQTIKCIVSSARSYTMQGSWRFACRKRKRPCLSALCFSKRDHPLIKLIELLISFLRIPFHAFAAVGISVPCQTDFVAIKMHGVPMNVNRNTTVSFIRRISPPHG